MVRLLVCIHFPDCTGAQKHTPSERARGHSPREQGGGGPRPGPAVVLRTSPTAPFRMCIARGVQVHQQCKSLRLSRKAQHFAGKGEGGANGKGQPSQPASPADLFSQVKSVKSVWQSFWTGGRVDVFYVPFAYTCINSRFRTKHPTRNVVRCRCPFRAIYHLSSYS